MTESEAYDVAVARLQTIGVSFYLCYSRLFKRDCEMRPGPLGERDLPKGSRRKVWGFGFAFREYPPDVIVSGNACVVFVDDDTGICSYMVSL